MRKLTVIVTCTDRKTVPVTPELRVRSLAPGSVEDRAAAWAVKIRAARGKRPLRQLYQGETWAQVGRLENAARRAGYEPRTLVASAGLGLRDLEYDAPAYGATFSRPHEDSVGSTQDQARDWWRALLSPNGAGPDTLPVMEGPMLWVLSESYARVIATDLLERSATDDLLVFGGSAEVPAEHRVPSNRALRSHLGGTATSLNLRMASRWIEIAGTRDVFAEGMRDFWDAWCTGVEQHDRYDRTPVTDGAVLDFIRALRRTEPTLTKTRALRQFRDAGLACEQRRFGALFVQAGAGT